MWIRSQKRDAVVNLVAFYVVKGPIKGRKGMIYGTYAGASSLNSMSIGEYETYDDALMELNNIQNAIIENPSGVYQLK
jgi:hypothetical protein